MNRYDRIAVLLSQIDQQLAETEDLGNDETLKMRDLFKLCEAREGLMLARRKIEAMFTSDPADDPMH